MSAKLNIAKIASVAERIFDVIKPNRNYGAAEIDPYYGYVTPTEITLRGRVLSRKSGEDKITLDENSTLWANFKAMMALFNTKELADIKLTCMGAETQSDEEGYFELKLPRPAGQTGWLRFDVQFEGGQKPAKLSALVPPKDAKYGIISDIDDTLIKTDAWSLRRNLWNSLTGNAESRYVFPDAIELIQDLHADINPVFYVSSSPWNMHGFLADIFERAGLVQGPKFLRDLGISETKFITGKHGHHKGDAIDDILEANPDLCFILLGDTGQHDAHVYHDAALRHPGRIRQIILRAPTPVLSKKNQDWVNKIEATQTPIFVGETYQALLS